MRTRAGALLAGAFEPARLRGRGVAYSPWLRDGISNQPTVWRQPGDGFGWGCTNWVPIQSCNGPWDPQNPDLLFSLIGETTPVQLQKFELE